MSVKFMMDKSAVQRELLKNKGVVPELQRHIDGKSFVIYKGDRIVVRAKPNETNNLSPRERAKAVMRNAKTPAQKRYAKFLFAQAGRK
ncbi:MAG: hypothetical protein RR582_06795 [Niameybacter sp.]